MQRLGPPCPTVSSTTLLMLEKRVAVPGMIPEKEQAGETHVIFALPETYNFLPKTPSKKIDGILPQTCTR